MGWDGPPMRRNSTGKRHKFRAARIVLKREFLIRPFLKSIDTLDRCYVIACCVVKFSSSPFIHSFIIYPDIDDSFRIERRKKKIRNSKSLVQSARIPPTILIYLSACCPRNRNSDSKFRATENRRLLGRLDEDRDHRLSLSLSRSSVGRKRRPHACLSSWLGTGLKTARRRGARGGACFLEALLRLLTPVTYAKAVVLGRRVGRLVARPWSAREESGRRDGLEKMAKYVCGSELSWSGCEPARFPRSDT